MRKFGEADVSFSSSSTSDTQSGNDNNCKEILSDLFSNLFTNTETSSCGFINDNHVTLAVTAVADVSKTPKKNDCSNHDAETAEIKQMGEPCDIQKNNACSNENDNFSMLSTDTLISERNQLPSHSKVPVPIFMLRTDNVSVGEEESVNSGCKKLIDANALRRVCSNSKIPISTKRINTKPQVRNLFFPSTSERCSQRQSSNDRTELWHKPPEKFGSKKYNHIKSKVAAYIHRSAKTDARANMTRSVSPVVCKTRNDEGASQEGTNKISSKTSLETYGYEYKMPSAEISLDHDKSENSGDSHQKIRKHVELALEYNRKKLEKERIIAEHHRAIAEQHQLVLEHSEKANDSLQKVVMLLLSRK